MGNMKIDYDRRVDIECEYSHGLSLFTITPLHDNIGFGVEMHKPQLPFVEYASYLHRFTISLGVVTFWIDLQRFFRQGKMRSF